MIYYRLTILENGSALSVNKDKAVPGSQLIVSDEAENDLQLWSVTLHESSEWNVGIILINLATGLMAAPEFVGNNAKVILVKVPTDYIIPTKYAWQTNSAVGDSNNDRTIMPLDDGDQVLACWHTPNVITYNWQGGKLREKWKFTQVQK